MALVLVCLVGGYCAWDVASYAYALHVESKWRSQPPSTRVELESLLGLYDSRDIEPSESQLGSGTELETGQKMVQYRLLWKAELDVVYDTVDTIVAIFTSYE